MKELKYDIRTHTIRKVSDNSEVAKFTPLITPLEAEIIVATYNEGVPNDA